MRKAAPGSVHSDIIHFQTDTAYDEVISNMPFGQRVGTHWSNERLYRDFFSAMRSATSANARLFLLTNEKKLIADCIHATGCFTLIDEVPFSSGGLFPSLFIIGRRADNKKNERITVLTECCLCY